MGSRRIISEICRSLRRGCLTSIARLKLASATWGRPSLCRNRRYSNASNPILLDFASYFYQALTSRLRFQSHVTDSIDIPTSPDGTKLHAGKNKRVRMRPYPHRIWAVTVALDAIDAACDLNLPKGCFSAARQASNCRLLKRVPQVSKPFFHLRLQTKRALIIGKNGATALGLTKNRDLNTKANIALSDLILFLQRTEPNL